ncbi:hypothetical protein RYX36_012059 [Vicia faba]
MLGRPFPPMSILQIIPMRERQQDAQTVRHDKDYTPDHSHRMSRILRYYDEYTPDQSHQQNKKKWKKLPDNLKKAIWDDITGDLVEKSTQDRLQKELQQQRIELKQQLETDMEDEGAKIQKEIKLLREMQLELHPKSTKEMFSKENVQNMGTSTDGSYSIENVNTISEDYLKEIGDLEEDFFSLDVIHETSELSVYIDKLDLNELISDIKWISTSTLSLWCLTVTAYHSLRGVKKKKLN